MAKKRTRSSTKSTRKTKKRRVTKPKTLKKKFAHRNRYNLLDAPPARKKGSRASAQPKGTRVRAQNPQDVSALVLREVKKRESLTPEKAKSARKAKWKRVKNTAKKSAMVTKKLIEDTGKALDYAGKVAEKIAPTLNTLALETDNPYLAAFAGGVDLAAGAHHEIHALIDATDKAHQKGDFNRLGIPEVSDTKKRIKMSATDEGGDFYMFPPENIDLPPPEDMPHALISN